MIRSIETYRIQSKLVKPPFLMNRKPRSPPRILFTDSPECIFHMALHERRQLGRSIEYIELVQRTYYSASLNKHPGASDLSVKSLMSVVNFNAWPCSLCQNKPRSLTTPSKTLTWHTRSAMIDESFHCFTWSFCVLLVLVICLFSPMML